jgi:UDP-N-acetylmuramoyl-L-alanyl-D-glutamate--2,6-diaminopimelate ligase
MMAARSVADARTLGDLLGSAAGPHARLAINDLVLDSRQAGPGAAFVAVAGGREHGLAYAAQARAQGAVVVLYEPAAEHAAPPGPSIAIPGLRAQLPELARRFFALAAVPRITGITGTNGKTTVAYLLAQALSRPGRPCAYIGTLGFGTAARLTAHGLTTPDCLTLHRELAELQAARVAMEVSSHALAQERIAGLAFHTAVFTNLTRDHLDEHGDFEHYGAAKARLFRMPGLRYAVLNADDPFAHRLAAAVPSGCEVIRTSLRGAADLGATLVRADLNGIELALAGRFGAARLVSPLIGDFNAENLLVAAGALVADGMPLAAAAATLGTAQPAPGRMEVLGGSAAAPRVIVDYAHTPDALQRTLHTIKALTRGQVTCVFGCGGDRDRGKRPLMGEIAGRLAYRVVLTDDNPRSEDPQAIVAEIEAGMSRAAQVTVIHDRRAAIAAAIAAADANDVVVIAGKGHEAVQIAGGAARPFSDRAVALEALGLRH